MLNMALFIADCVHIAVQPDHILARTVDNRPSNGRTITTTLMN
jgi:hypothetical protein